jgi:hypothetical protein
MTRYNALCEGARRAARTAMVHGDAASRLGPLGPASMVFAADDSNSVATAVRNVLMTMDPAEVQIQLEWPDGFNTTDDRVKATLSYEHRSILPSFLGIVSFDFKTTSVMAIEH